MNNLIKIEECTYIDCPICGKKKLIGYPYTVTKYVHKTTHKKGGVTYYCSHTCKMEAERRSRARKAKHATQKRKQNIEILGKTFWQEAQSGMNAKDIAKKYKRGTSTVYRYLKAYREVMA